MTRPFPLVVACVPTWNAESFLEPTLESIAAQTYPNLKILISNDASSDRTLEICERFATRDSRFHVMDQPQRLGWVGNVNALLRAARGDYFLFAFHDDLLKPTYVEKLVEKLEEKPEAILAFSDIELVQLSGDGEILQHTALEGVTQRGDRAARVILQQGQWWIPHRGVFRAIAAEKIGGLKRHLAGEFSADWPWLLHLSLLGQFVRVPEVLCCKVYKKSSLSRSWDFSARAWIAVALSCANEIRLSGLPFAEAVPLYGLLLRSCLHRYWKRWRSRLAFDHLSKKTV